MYPLQKVYYDKENNELRIPLSEILPTMPLMMDQDLNIKAFIPKEELKYLLPSNKTDRSLVARYCEFFWTTRA